MPRPQLVGQRVVGVLGPGDPRLARSRSPRSRASSGFQRPFRWSWCSWVRITRSRWPPRAAWMCFDDVADRLRVRRSLGGSSPACSRSRSARSTGSPPPCRGKASRKQSPWPWRYIRTVTPRRRRHEAGRRRTARSARRLRVLARRCSRANGSPRGAAGLAGRLEALPSARTALRSLLSSAAGASPSLSLRSDAAREARHRGRLPAGSVVAPSMRARAPLRWRDSRAPASSSRARVRMMAEHVLRRVDHDRAAGAELEVAVLALAVGAAACPPSPARRVEVAARAAA